MEMTEATTIQKGLDVYAIRRQFPALERVLREFKPVNAFQKLGAETSRVHEKAVHAIAVYRDESVSLTLEEVAPSRNGNPVVQLRRVGFREYEVVGILNGA